VSAIVLSVDDPGDLWFGRPASRDRLEPPEAREREKPFEQVLFVVANAHNRSARVRLTTVLLGDREARLAFQEPGEERSIHFGDAERELGHASMVRRSPAENPCKAQ
jgi:hypothetical protein